jgi:diaminopimelate epimerase
VQVLTHGGTLSIAWDGQDQPVFLTGPAISVFDGEITI